MLRKLKAQPAWPKNQGDISSNTSSSKEATNISKGIKRKSESEDSIQPKTKIRKLYDVDAVIPYLLSKEQLAEGGFPTPEHLLLTSAPEISLKNKCVRCKKVFEYKFIEREDSGEQQFVLELDCLYHPGKLRKGTGICGYYCTDRDR